MLPHFCQDTVHTPSFLTPLHISVCLLSGRGVVQGANMLSCWENGERWDEGIVMLEGVNWCYQPLVWFLDNYCSPWSCVWAKQMAGALQVPHLVSFLNSDFPTGSLFTLEKRGCAWMLRSWLGVLHRTQHTLLVSPGLAQWLGRGWRGDAEWFGDISGFLRSRGTHALGWCFILRCFLL